MVIKNKIEDRYQSNYLFDFYNELFTDNQKEIFINYYEHNYSICEIAEYKRISRQAVSDTLKKVKAMLKNYESKLKLGSNFKQRIKQNEQLESMILSYRDKGKIKKNIADLLIKQISKLGN